MAYIPFQNHIQEGAAVKLRTPQAPDWTAKYQLAAQERRMREAERAKKEKDPNAEAGAELRKTISGINPTWAKEDTEGIDRMYNKIWETMDASGGNYSDPKFQQEISKQVWDLKAAMDLSKNWETRANTRTKEIVDNGVDDYENVEIFNDLKSGKFGLPAADGSKIEYDINKVKTLEDFAKFNQAREMAMDLVQKKFDENTYMAKHLPLAKKGATVTDYITLPNGDKEVRTVEKPEIFEAELQKVYNGKQGLKKVYEERFVADPKGFATAEEMFQAAYNPYFGSKKTTPKSAPTSSTYGQGATDENWQKSAGKTSTFKFGNGLIAPSIGNYTITETPVTFKSSEAIDIKTGKKYGGKVTEGTMGQVHILPINSKTGEPTTSGDADAKYMPMVVVKTPATKTEKAYEILLPVSVGRGAAESKESKEERETLKKRLDWSEEWAGRANEGKKSKGVNTGTTPTNRIESTSKSGKAIYSDDGGKTWKYKQ